MESGSGFEDGSDHHVLFDTSKNKTICSVDTLKIQNTTINQLEEKKWDAKAIGAELKNIDSISERVGNINKTWGQ